MANGDWGRLPKRARLSEGSCICRVPGCEIPKGYCHCGCGRKTSIAKTTEWKYGWIQGEPKHFIVGHANRLPRVIEKVAPFKIDGVYCRLIPLSKGLHAIVDASDYEWLMQYRWTAAKNDKGGGWYAVSSERMVDGKRGEYVRMHRLILGLEKGDQRKGDHRDNLNTLDNRRKNLRIATNAQNTMNCRRKSNNHSGLKGVIPTGEKKNPWRADIRVDGRLLYLGRFPTKERAHAAYCEAALKYFGEFARVA